MGTAQTLGLGAIAGFTIFLGLPIGRMQGVKPATKAFLAATATGILVFLLWDVLSQAVDPVETALTDGRDGRFAWLAILLSGGFLTGLMSLVYYDLWMKRRRRRAFLGPGAASTAEFEHEHHFTGMSPARWLALFIATGIGLHNFSEGLAIGQSAAADKLSLGTVIGQAWVNQSVMIVFFALAAGSILYVVMELINVGRALASKTVVTWGILLGLFLGFATDFILVAAGGQLL